MIKNDSYILNNISIELPKFAENKNTNRIKQKRKVKN